MTHSYLASWIMLKSAKQLSRQGSAGIIALTFSIVQPIDMLASLSPTPARLTVLRPTSLRPIPTHPKLTHSNPAQSTVVTDAQQPVNQRLLLPGRFVQFSPDGKTIVVADGESTRLYELAGGISSVFPGKFLAFHPNGKIMVTRDRTLTRLYDLTNGKTVTLPDGFMQFSPDGETIVASSNHITRLYTFQGKRLATLLGSFRSIESELYTILTQDGGCYHLFTSRGRKLLSLEGDSNLMFSPNQQAAIVIKKAKNWPHFAPSLGGVDALGYLLRRSDWDDRRVIEWV